MSKKNLNPDGLLNELKGGSSFFPVREETQLRQEHSSLPTPPASLQQKKPEEKIPDTMTPRYRDTKHDTTVSSNHDTTISSSEDQLLEAVRKAVKQVGKEAATQRLTLEEKQALADIEYSYQRQGIRTSGNEIMRIATNYIVRDYRKNGEQSVLAQVLKKLNS